MAFDLPGHGKSPPVDTVNLDVLIDAVDAARNSIDGSRIILIGHSLGCRLALESASRRPEGLSGLVLIEAGLVGGGDAVGAARAIADSINVGGIEAFLMSFFADRLIGSNTAPSRDEIMGRLNNIDRSFAQTLLQNLGPWDKEDAARLLESIYVPLLAIQSTDRDGALQRRSLSPTMVSPWLELVSKVARDATIEIVENVGHFPQIEAKERVGSAIAAFAGRYEASLLNSCEPGAGR